MPLDPPPLSEWHKKIILHFWGRSKHAMLSYLKRTTGAAWEMLEYQQRDRPRTVVIRLRDLEDKYDPIRVRITAATGDRVKIESGQVPQLGNRQLVPASTLFVRADAIPGATLFDWIESKGIHRNMAQRFQTESCELVEGSAMGPQLPIPHIKPEYHFLPQQREAWNSGLKYAREYLADPPYAGQQGKQSMASLRRWLKTQKGEVTLDMILATGYPASAPPPQLEAAQMLSGKAGAKIKRMKEESNKTRDWRKATALTDQHIPFWAAAKATAQHIIGAWTREPPTPPHIVKWTRAVAEKILGEWEVEWEKKNPPKTGFEKRVKRRLRRR